MLIHTFSNLFLLKKYFKINLCLVVFFLLSNCAHKKYDTSKYLPKDGELFYQLTLDDSSTEVSLFVEMWVLGDTFGTTEILLPHEWKKIKDFKQGILNLNVNSPEAKINFSNENKYLTIKHPPSAPIHISYTVKQYRQSFSNNDQNFLRPILNNKYLYFIGHGVFAVPNWHRKEITTTKIFWKNLPDKWNIINSLGGGRHYQKITSHLEDIQNSIYMAGDFRITNMTINKRPLAFVTRGEKLESDLKVAVTIKDLVQSHRDFFQNYTPSLLLISLLPVDAPCCIQLGMGHYNTYASYWSGETLNIDKLKNQISQYLFFKKQGIENNP